MEGAVRSEGQRTRKRGRRREAERLRSKNAGLLYIFLLCRLECEFIFGTVSMWPQTLIPLQLVYKYDKDTVHGDLFPFD